MDDQKEEIENLRKQIKSLKISLMLTQISTIAFTIIFGCQCLRSIQNYHYLLQQVRMCLESVNTVYSALQQFVLTFWMREVRKIEGYYTKEIDQQISKGRLHIEVMNFQEFAELIRQAKTEADQLQKTINRLRNFELEIDFDSISRNTTLEK